MASDRCWHSCCAPPGALSAPSRGAPGWAAPAGAPADAASSATRALMADRYWPPARTPPGI
eukprot:13957879-Alexandrium_andersonii.AAC.1